MSNQENSKFGMPADPLPQFTDLPPAYSQVQQGGQTILVQQPVMQQVYSPIPLTHTPQNIICPSCHSSIRTRVHYKSSSKTHLIAVLFCLFAGCCGCCLVPYCKIHLKFRINHFRQYPNLLYRCRRNARRRTFMPAMWNVYWNPRALKTCTKMLLLMNLPALLFAKQSCNLWTICWNRKHLWDVKYFKIYCF